MLQIDVPPFVKNIGHRIVAYILNLSEDDAFNVLHKRAEISVEKAKILQEFICICQKFRMNGIDQTDVDSYSFDSFLRSLRSKDNVFNVWRMQAHGNIDILTSEDPIIDVLNKIASKLYPFFLIKMKNSPLGNILRITSDIHHLPEHEILCSNLMKDPIISPVIDLTGENENENDVGLSYKTFSGYQGKFPYFGSSSG